VMDLATKVSRVFEVTGLTPPAPPKATEVRDTSDAIAIDAKSIAAGKQMSVKVNLSIPSGYKLNDLAPVTWEVFTDAEQVIFPAETLGERDEAAVADDVASFDIPLTGESAMATVYVRVSYGYCGMGENALCRLASATWRIPVTTASDATESMLSLSFPATP